jgi:hypothetical protein
MIMRRIPLKKRNADAAIDTSRPSAGDEPANPVRHNDAETEHLSAIEPLPDQHDERAERRSISAAHRDAK